MLLTLVNLFFSNSCFCLSAFCFSSSNVAIDLFPFFHESHIRLKFINSVPVLETLQYKIGRNF